MKPLLKNIKENYNKEEKQEEDNLSTLKIELEKYFLLMVLI